jgi:hypothetical protein
MPIVPIFPLTKYQNKLQITWTYILDHSSPFWEAFGPKNILLKEMRKCSLNLLPGVSFGLA